MKEKLGRNTKIIILVLCIMLTIIGVAYSFIAPLISGVETESTISFNSGMIKITYQGSNVITGENIIPGWSETKEFTVVGSNNTSINDEDIMDYAIKLVVEENTFSDGAIRFELTGSSSNELDTLFPLFGKVPTGTGETLLGTARFNQDDNIKSDVTHTYSLKIGFPNDPSKNQNKDMNKNFSGYVVVEEGTLQEQEPLIISEYITKQYTDSFDGINYLQEDDFGNIRYVGATPKNYIIFNDETWRIIGVVDDGVKIIRQDRITDADGNNTFKWDTTSSNDWTTSSLKTYLNGTYYNSLTATAQEQIEERTWNIGGVAYNSNGYEIKETYSQERGETTYNNSRPTTWKGNIALMYPSDWGYASTNISCRNNFNSGYCSSSNWLYTSRIESGTDTSQYEDWTLSPNSSYSYYAFYVGSSGYVEVYYIYFDIFGGYSLGARPVVYLKSNIQIISGNGSKDNPFIIQ